MAWTGIGLRGGTCQARQCTDTGIAEQYGDIDQSIFPMAWPDGLRSPSTTRWTGAGLISNEDREGRNRAGTRDVAYRTLRGPGTALPWRFGKLLKQGPALRGRAVYSALRQYALATGMAKKSIRVSHIGIPGDLSVLKLKSYLRSALAEAAQGSGDNEILLVKVLVPQPLGLRAGEKLFDKVLQGIVDKDPRVKRVSVEFIDGEVTPAKIAESQARTQKEIDAYGHLLEASTDDEPPGQTT